MQVDHLVVIVFADPAAHRSDEVLASGRGLFNKERKRPPHKKYLYCVNTKPVATASEAKEGRGLEKFLSRERPIVFEGQDVPKDRNNYAQITHIDGAHIGDDARHSEDVGVYLVFHCDRSTGVPQVFDAAKEPVKAPIHMYKKKVEIARGMVQLVRAVGVNRVRKLALIACNTAQDPTNDRSFLDAFCEAMVEGFTSPPIIAGWDEYVTVDEQTGKKLVTNDKKPGQEMHQHKWISTYNEGAYSLCRYEFSGWSDGRHLATPQGPTPALMCSLF